jgi:hypothetical protein
MSANKADRGLWKELMIHAEVAEKKAKTAKIVVPKGDE